MKFIRAIWVLVFLASIGILLGSLPGYWTRVNQIALSAEFSPMPQTVPWLGVLLSVGNAVLCLALAVLLFLKKPNDRMALFLCFYLLLYGIILVGPLENFLPFWFPAFGDLALQVQGLIFVISLALILVFPNGQFVPRWTRWLAVIAILELPVAVLTIGDFSELYRINSLTAQILYGVLGALLFPALGVQVYRYRKLYTPLERQQTKWVSYGFVLWLVLLALVSIPWIVLQNSTPGAPAPLWQGLGSVGWQFSLSILPLAFTIAILRSRLWNIDILIRRTVTYSLLTALLLAVYFGIVIVLQRAFSALTGAQQNEIVTVVSTLAIAILFVPLRRRIQDFLDRRFYRRKYDAQKVLAQFAIHARDETDLNKLTDELIRVVAETMQPEKVELWLKRTERKR